MFCGILGRESYKVGFGGGFVGVGVLVQSGIFSIINIGQRIGVRVFSVGYSFSYLYIFSFFENICRYTSCSCFFCKKFFFCISIIWFWYILFFFLAETRYSFFLFLQVIKVSIFLFRFGQILFVYKNGKIYQVKNFGLLEILQQVRICYARLF